MKSKLTIVVLLVIIAGLLYKFVVAGDTRPVPDGRSAVQQIVQGLAQGDAKQIEAAALPVGTRAMKRIRVGTMAKLPYEYKQATYGMHRDFDNIAVMAHQGKDTKTIQMKLADAMNRCISCHASYALAAPPPAK